MQDDGTPLDQQMTLYGQRHFERCTGGDSSNNCNRCNTVKRQSQPRAPTEARSPSVAFLEIPVPFLCHVKFWAAEILFCHDATQTPAQEVNLLSFVEVFISSPAYGGSQSVLCFCAQQPVQIVPSWMALHIWPQSCGPAYSATLELILTACTKTMGPF